MTSEGTQHPGQQPDEASPGAGGPTPYGDRPAQQDNGHATGNAGLGWAPPPPAQPSPAAPAWSTDVPPAPAWSSGQLPQQTETPAPGAWAPDGGAPQWHGQNEQSGRTEASEAPAWAQTESAVPAWAQQGPAARGAAQVPPAAPTWPGQETPAEPGAAQPAPAWGNAQPEPTRAGGWAPAHQPDQSHSGAWGTATRQDERPQQPDWATTPQGDTGGQADQPVWAAPQPAVSEQPAQASEAPAWTPARGAAQVPGAPQAWPGQDDRSADQSTPDHSGAAWPGGQQEAGAPGGWPAEAAREDRRQPDDQDGWATGSADEHRQHPQFAPHQDDAARSGGWAAGRADDQPQQGWPSPGDRDAAGQPAATDAWAGNDPQSSGGWAGRAATNDDGGWNQGDPAARASASVPTRDDAPQSWAPPAPRSGADRPAVPDVQPWAPGEAWGRNEPAAEATREPERAEEPAYQPAPAPGISPANAVPLPPQEQRVPGASLAADPPAGFPAPAPFAPEQPARDDAAASHEREQQGWAPGARHDEAPAAPVVPAPRTSPESTGRASVPAATGGTSGSVSASASVPTASRVTPPADQALPPAAPAPQPRVYGRPARPEGADEAEASNGYPGDQQRFGPEAQPEQGQGTGFGPGGDDRPAGPSAFAAAAPVAPAPPAPFPPGVPSFADAPVSDRPVNGTRPHAGGERPADHFGAPATGAASVNASGFPPPPEPAFPPAFPPPAQPAMPSWDQGGHGGQATPEQEQGRFDAFKPIAEPTTEAPPPKVRNGRVLAAVLVAAVAILTIPLGLLLLLGKVGGDDPAPTFDPALGSCVKQAGTGAAAADCGEEGAFTVVSKVDAKEKCADPAQPHVELPGGGSNRVLCLKPAS